MHSSLRYATRVLLLLPAVAEFLFTKEIGAEYGITWWAKLRLLVRFRNNTKHIETLSGLSEHMELAAAILSVPRAVIGDVVECGCYRGGSSVNLSIVCALTGRRLLICDSFQGLPDPRDYDRSHLALHANATDNYEKGRFAASLETVKRNLAQYGNLEVCDFSVGFFDETMPQLRRPLVAAFLDVDLIDSLRPCLRGIWPLLRNRSRLYVHEARDLALVFTFFDVSWWRTNIGEEPPGFIGSGVGLPLGASVRWGSEIGYAQKGYEVLTRAEYSALHDQSPASEPTA